MTNANTVPTVELGDELTVSAIGFGAMALTPVYGEVDDADSLATLHRTVDLGVTFIDTANIYGNGNNEKLIAKLLADRRDEVTLATKFGIQGNPADRAAGRIGVRGDAAYVRQSIDESLQRLQTDVVDLYYMHRRDVNVPIEETVGVMAELVREGKVKQLGLSEVTASELRTAQAVHPIAAVQSEWSLFSRDIEAKVVPAARDLGVALVPYSPLGRGFLAGRFTSPDELEANDWRRENPRFKDSNLEANLRLAAKVKEIAAEKDVTPAQLAIAWVLAQGEDLVPIPGTKRRSYLEQNAAAVDITLTKDDLARIDAELPEVAGERYDEAGMRSVNR
jgi:aryl-alcohol dehydrogenase-like predicted oxidoreductase